jgi:hypothetical protein
VTVAVKVTDCPKTDGVSEVVTAVVESAGLTVTDELAGPLSPAEASAAVMVVVWAFRSVVANVVVDWPEAKLTVVV